MKNPLVFAHRGASGSAPENTLSSFQRAIDWQADFLELDVHLTKDCQLAVIHDPSLERTTNGSGNVAEYTLEELQRFEAGSWFGPEFRNERIPSLQEVLQLTNHRIKTNIEVKSDQNSFPDDIMASTLKKCLETLDVMDQVLISSFDFELLKTIGRKIPGIKLAYLFQQWTPDVEQNIKEPMLNAIHPIWHITDNRLVLQAHQLGLAVNVWTVNETDLMQHFTTLGVDGIITNYPEQLIALLKKYRTNKNEF